MHDIVGHAATGFEFGPRREENAYRFHAEFYSAIAGAALAAETRLQNSCVNFGAHLWDADGRYPARTHPASRRGFDPMQRKRHSSQPPVQCMSNSGKNLSTDSTD